jgi:hypothetical protein
MAELSKVIGRSGVCALAVIAKADSIRKVIGFFMDMGLDVFWNCV